MSQHKRADDGIDVIWRFVSAQGIACCITRADVFTHTNAAFELLASINRADGLTEETEFNHGEWLAAFKWQDQQVYTIQKSVRFLDIRQWANGWHIFLVNKGAINGSDSILTQYTDVTDISSAIQMAVASHRKLMPLTEVLTRKELTVLYFLLRGRTAKSIAKILNRSPRTIEHSIERIKGKLGADSRTDLIELAINHGYYSVLPAEVFCKPMTIALT